LEEKQQPNKRRMRSKRRPKANQVQGTGTETEGGNEADQSAAGFEDESASAGRGSRVSSLFLTAGGKERGS
jgi:hypothetical protein